MTTFGTLALVVAVGLFGPILASLPTKLAPPIVIGEILAGVVVGRTGTHTIDPSQATLALLADIGLALLMLIVGTHIPVRDPRLRPATRRGLVAAALTTAFAIGLAFALGTLTGVHKPGVLAVLIAGASAAIVLPILDSEHPDNALLTTFAWVSILDVVAVVAVPFVLATGGVARTLFGTALVILGAALVGYLAHRFRAFPFVDKLRAESRQGGWALDLRLSLLVLFTLAWIAERFHTSVLIAGFAVGVAIAAIPPPRRFGQQLVGIGEGFFVPLFFVVLGASLDLRALAQSADDLKLLVLLAVAMVIVPVVVARMVGLGLDHGLVAAAKMGVPSAVASVGLITGALRPGQGAAIVGAAGVSIAVAAFGATRLRARPDAPAT